MEIIIGRDEEDSYDFGEKGTIVLGKNLVGTGEETHLTTEVKLDVLRPHVITLCGKRGSGKSHSLGVIAEGIANAPEDVKENICGIMIDTQGIFWTMKTPNEKDLSLLRDWKLSPKAFDIKVYVPEGQLSTFETSGVEFDDKFSFLPSELTTEDWLSVFDLNINEPLGVLLQSTLSKLHGDYSLDDMIKNIQNIEGFEKEKISLHSLLESAKHWGIFGHSGAPDLLVPGKISVLDFSITPQRVRTLMLALLGRKIFAERVKARRKEELAEMEYLDTSHIPVPWLMIDEAHNFIPADGKTSSTDILNKIVKEGRQPGISVVFATQRPMKLHPDVLAQCDVIISHRLTTESDVDSLKSIMQTYMMFDITKYINELPKLKGTAIVLDDNSERIYKIRVKPRQSWHAGASALAI